MKWIRGKQGARPRSASRCFACCFFRRSTSEPSFRTSSCTTGILPASVWIAADALTALPESLSFRIVAAGALALAVHSLALRSTTIAPTAMSSPSGSGR